MHVTGEASASVSSSSRGNFKGSFTNYVDMILGILDIFNLLLVICLVSTSLYMKKIEDEFPN